MATLLDPYQQPTDRTRDIRNRLTIAGLDDQDQQREAQKVAIEAQRQQIETAKANAERAKLIDARAQNEDQRATAAETRRVSDDQQAKDLATARIDARQWAGTPGYGVTYDKLPDEARAHFDAYSPQVAAAAPEIYNQALHDRTGVIPGLDETMQAAGQTVSAKGDVSTAYKTKAVEEPQFDEFTTPQDVLDKMPANESGLAQQLARHDISIANLSRLPAPTKMRIINAAQVFNPEWKSSDFPIRQKSRQSFTSGPLGATKTAINTAIHHLDTVMEKAPAMKNTGSPFVNSAINPIARGIGTDAGKATREFDVAAQLLASELAKIVKGGTPTQMEVREQMQNFSHDLDPDTLRGNIESAVELLSGKLDGLRTQYQDAYQAPAKFGFIDQDSRKILKKHGFDPDKIDPVEGDATKPKSKEATAEVLPPAANSKPKIVRQNGVIYTLGEDGQYH